MKVIRTSFFETMVISRFEALIQHKNPATFYSKCCNLAKSRRNHIIKIFIFKMLKGFS